MPIAVGFLTALVATPAASWIATRVGLVDRPDTTGLKIHRAPIPLAGGLGIFAGLVAVSVVKDWSPWLLLGAAGLALSVGVADDALELGVGLRSLALAAAGALLWAELRPDLDGPLPITLFLVLLLVSGCANGVNLLDGQNGLAGGVAAISCFGLALFLGDAPGPVPAELGPAIAGCAAGFLVWNWPKPRTFMGDGGAYLMGVCLAALCAVAIGTLGLRGLAIAGTCVGIILFEVCFTVLRRIGGSQSVVTGDRGHSYDLIAARVGRDATTIIYWLTGAALIGIATWMRGAGETAVLIASILLPLLGVIVGTTMWKVAGGRLVHNDQIDSRSM